MAIVSNFKASLSPDNFAGPSCAQQGCAIAIEKKYGGGSWVVQEFLVLGCFGQALNVWYIYLLLGYFRGLIKCRYIRHTWNVWVRNVAHEMNLHCMENTVDFMMGLTKCKRFELLYCLKLATSEDRCQQLNLVFQNSCVVYHVQQFDRDYIQR